MIKNSEITSTDLLRTKWAAKFEMHEGLISIQLADQLNSHYPHSFHNVFPALNPFTSKCMCYPHTTDIIVIPAELWSFHILIYKVNRNSEYGAGIFSEVKWLHLFFFFSSFFFLSDVVAVVVEFRWDTSLLSARIIEIPHLISKVTLPGYGLPARIYSRLPFEIDLALFTCGCYQGRKFHSEALEVDGSQNSL